MAMMDAQLIAGILAGLVIVVLMLRTPMLRDLLAALAAAGLMELLVGNHSLHGADSAVDRLALAISSHPYFTIGLIVAATAAAALRNIGESQ